MSYTITSHYTLPFNTDQNTEECSMIVAMLPKMLAFILVDVVLNAFPL